MSYSSIYTLSSKIISPRHILPVTFSYRKCSFICTRIFLAILLVLVQYSTHVSCLFRLNNIVIICVSHQIPFSSVCCVHDHVSLPIEKNGQHVVHQSLSFYPPRNILTLVHHDVLPEGDKERERDSQTETDRSALRADDPPRKIRITTQQESHGQNKAIPTLSTLCPHLRSPERQHVSLAPNLSSLEAEKPLQKLHTEGSSHAPPTYVGKHEMRTRFPEIPSFS